MQHHYQYLQRTTAREDEKMSEKQKKVPYSVRMDEATRQEIKDLIAQNGGTPEELMEQMVSAYKLNKAMSAVPNTREDVRSLRLCMASIESTFTALLMRMESEIDSITRQSNVAVMEAQRDAKAVQARCDDQVAMLRGDLDKMMERYEAADRIAATAKADKEDMVEKLKAATDTLTATQELLEQYRAKPSADDLQKDLEKAHARIRDLEAAESRHKAAMDKAELEHRQELIAATEAHQEAIAAMQKEYADAIKAMGLSAKKTEAKK